MSDERALSRALAAALAICLLASCRFDLSSGFDTSPLVNFRYFWELYAREYALFEEKGLDWEAVKARTEPFVREDMSEDELFDLLAGMLYLLNDRHDRLSSPGRFANSGRANEVVTLFSEVRATGYLDRAIVAGEGRIVHGRIASRPSIAYLRIGSFAPGHSTGSMAARHSAWAEDIDGVLVDLIGEGGQAGAEALIVDLRDNQGGLLQDVAFIAGRFFGSELVYALTREKSGPGPTDFSPPYELRILPAGRTVPPLPILVLTNELTTSAGEFMSLALLRRPDARQGGTRTAGAFSFRTLHELPNGWTCTVSMQKVLSPEGVSYEGVGIVPDPARRWANSAAGIAAGRDEQLEAAIADLGSH
ncbi:MAG: S41 family peptidase [Spirochaetaceae bacterium]|nr:S41 family peptidase [Spirochaetaceae bacterium]